MDICQQCGAYAYNSNICIDCYKKSKQTTPNGICRSGCPTQDHKSYGDCLQDARISVDKTSLRP